MAEIRMAQLGLATSAEYLAQSPPKLRFGSSLAEVNWGQFGGPNREERLAELRFVDIKADTLDYGVGRENIIRLLPEFPFHGKAVVPKLALSWVAPQDKYFVQTSPRKVSRSRRWRRVRRQSRDNPLQLNIDFLVLTMLYSLGIVGLSFSRDCNWKRAGVKDFSLGRAGRKTHRRAFRDKGRACFVESYLVPSDAGYAFSKYRLRTMSMSYDGDRSEEVQSAYKRYNEVDKEIVMRKHFSLDQIQEQNDENDWSRTFKVSLFGLLQLIMLCLSLKLFFARVSVPFDDVVPT